MTGEIYKASYSILETEKKPQFFQTILWFERIEAFLLGQIFRLYKGDLD